MQTCNTISSKIQGVTEWLKIIGNILSDIYIIFNDKYLQSNCMILTEV
ncbi:MAG: hypothetical protein ACO4AC_10405 [Pseudohongiellaceae bacterium]